MLPGMSRTLPLGINFPVKPSDFPEMGSLVRKSISLARCQGYYFVCFPLLKNTAYDEPSAFKPWACGLAGFLFSVCLGGVFPSLLRK